MGSPCVGKRPDREAGFFLTVPGNGDRLCNEQFVVPDTGHDRGRVSVDDDLTKGIVFVHFEFRIDGQVSQQLDMFGNTAATVRPVRSRSARPRRQCGGRWPTAWTRRATSRPGPSGRPPRWTRTSTPASCMRYRLTSGPRSPPIATTPGPASLTPPPARSPPSGAPTRGSVRRRRWRRSAVSTGPSLPGRLYRAIGHEAAGRAAFAERGLPFDE